MTAMNSMLSAALAFGAMAFVQSASATVAPPPCKGDICTAKDKLVLSGVVETKCSLKVNAKAEATKLNIVDGEANTLVATVTESTNHLAGYKVTMSSANGGNLVHTSVPSEKVAYKLSYDGGAYLSPTTSAQQVKLTGALVAPVVDNSDVKINFAGKPSALAGTFSDTVTFEIAAL